MLPRTRRSALTLLELIVVLLILVALAGLIVPLLPNFLGRSQSAVGATNCCEITKLIQIHEQSQLVYPDNLDSLTSQAGTGIPDYLPTGGEFTSTTLTAAQAQALVNSGITTLADMRPNRAAFTPANTPTFNPYSGTLVPITTGTRVLQVSEAVVENSVIADRTTNTGDVYIVLGFGSRSTLLGAGAATAPTHFADSQTGNADLVYSRYGLIFRINRGSPAGALPMTKAKFVGTVSFSATGIVSADGHIAGYYQATLSE